jgi:hypothetical protein
MPNKCPFNRTGPILRFNLLACCQNAHIACKRCTPFYIEGQVSRFSTPVLGLGCSGQMPCGKWLAVVVNFGWQSSPEQFFPSAFSKSIAAPVSTQLRIVH